MADQKTPIDCCQYLEKLLLLRASFHPVTVTTFRLLISSLRTLPIMGRNVCVDTTSWSMITVGVVGLSAAAT